MKNWMKTSFFCNFQDVISTESLGKPGEKLVLLCYFNGSLHSTVPHKEIKILYPFRPYNGSFFRRGLPKGLFEWNTETDWTLYRENNSFSENLLRCD